ncbi:morphogenetic protein [Pseudomonas veronii]|uniref:morphogenetic protein n=1 Tax=Pseudomonas veronii TaxID=76761 RepID=UPI000625A377|nr:morphogenetic protein [Pseudomonas veronii]
MSEIKERPILFSAPMVRAILEGRKTVTRRAVKIQPRSKADIGSYGLGQPFIRNPDVTKPNPECPYGRAGDRLWVRETFAIESNRWADDPYSPPHKDGRPTQRYEDDKWDQPHYKATDAEPELWYDDRDSPGCRWKPSIHMPRWACRILLEITDVRVERLQDITPEQVTAEGVSTRGEAMWGGQWWVDAPQQAIEDARKDFADLWTSTGGDWNANPWVWVVEFKRVTP